MKKITFILFALIAGTTFAQVTATAVGSAAADIVSPITIAPQLDLNFGKVANNAAGTVVVATDGDFSASTLAQIGTTTPAAATFDVTAADGYAYGITFPSVSVELISGTNKITVNAFNYNASATTEGTGAIETISVGATLNVDASQPTGTYTGEFPVTVTYN